MKKIIVIAAVAACSMSLIANAFVTQIKPCYAEAFISTNYNATTWSRNLDNSNRPEVNYQDFAIGRGARVGYQFKWPFRVELAASYNKIAAAGGQFNTKGKTSITPLMFNSYFDIRNSTSFTPYIGAGIGYARMRLTHWAPANGRGSFDPYYTRSFQAIAGLFYSFCQNFSVNLNFTYWKEFRSEKIEQNSVYVDKIRTTMPTINLGLVYRFGFGKATTK